VHAETPTPAEIRTILAAAADVIFSDGVAEAFLDQWADETFFLLTNYPQTAPSNSAQ
jgi:hypothetical protein